VASHIDTQPVVIAGGGLSGLAAAVRLTSSGIPVILFEQRPRAGGRTFSFTERETGDVVDNGQHLLIAGYTRTLAFTDTVGSRPLLRVQERPALCFHHPLRGFVEFRLPRLTPPLNLLYGILTSSLFTPAERFAVLRAGIAMQSKVPPDLTIAGWLDRTRQPASVCASFWVPLAVSIMNERVETAQAAAFLDALRIAFLGHWHHAALVFPQGGLSAIFADPATQYIEAHGGSVRCGTGVRTLVTEDGRVTAVRLRDGSTVLCRGAIFAVPHTEIMELYPDCAGAPEQLVRMSQAPGAPIVSLHLWFRDEFMDRDAVGLIGRTIHWVFRKERHIALTISAAYDVVDLTREELVEIAVRELREVFGPRVGTPWHALMIREKQATLSLTPAVAVGRPGTRTALPNLFLAGDWTATGLPATIEGAIRSGEAAADLMAGAGI
jgi:hydroxysqualene dehydroxylase